MPNSLIVLRIYEINVRHIRLVITESDYDFVMERVKDYGEERVKEVTGQKLPRTLRAIVFCLHAEVFLGVFLG